MTLRDSLKELIPPVFLKIKRRLIHSGRAPAESPAEQSLRVAHERLNEGVDGNRLVLRSGISFRMHPEAIVAAKYFCYLSPDMVKEMDSFLSLTSDKRNFLDIGSLHGTFSLAFASTHPDGRVIAVDASPIAFAKLLYNVHANRFTNIETIECAVSDSPGVLRMHYEWEHVVSAGTDNAKSAVTEIEKRTGDDLCSAHNFTPDAIKIDVEGHELKVLRGLDRTISQHRPVVFLEIHPQRLIEEGDSAAAVASYLFGNHYRAMSTDGNPMSQQDIETLHRDERVVFVP